MNRKRPAAHDPPLSARCAKQQRTALFDMHGETQSPASAGTLDLSSRWKRVLQDFKEVGRDTLLLIRGRVEPSDSRSTSPENTIRHPEQSRTPSSSPEIISHTLGAATDLPDSLPTTPATAKSFAASQNSLLPTNLYASSSYSSLPSPHFSFTPRKGSSSQSSEISVATFPHRSSVSPSDNLYSSRRPRPKTLMGPPPNPIPSRSDVLYSQPFSSSERNLRSMISTPKTRNYQNRPHILVDKHKQAVKKSMEDTKDELYKLAQSQRGYKSNRQDFDSFLAYTYLLQSFGDAKQRLTFRESDSKLGPRNDLMARLVASMHDLRAEFNLDEDKTRSRRNSEPTIDNPRWLAEQLELARKVWTTPSPPAWAPSLDDLRIRHRAKDDDIEQRLRPKRAPLPSSLPPEDEVKVQALLKQRGVISKYAKEQVSNQDICRLKPGEWLNDEVINFYGAMILGRSEDSKENKENGAVNGVKKKNKVLNVHYFSTFFWQKLEREGYEKGRLAKWTKKIDLFSKDIVLIPVNHNNMHWTAAAINFQHKRIESYDSMMLNRSAVFKRLRDYLDAEHRNKKKTPFDFTGWENHILKETPQQENGYDCGVFTCQFLETLSRGEDTFNFCQDDIPYLRRRMIWEIGNAKLRTDP